MIEIVYTKKAIKFLKSIDLKLTQRIVTKISFYAETGDPLKHARKLVNASGDLYRFRVGVFRVVFTLDKKGNVQILNVLKIGHRREIYD